MTAYHIPREACIPDVRAELDAAKAHLATAAEILRAHEYGLSADDILQIRRIIAIYTEPNGYLHYLALPSREPGA